MEKNVMNQINIYII